MRESERDRERERETERNCARRQPDGLLPRGRALKPGEDKRQRERERKIAVLCCNPFVTTPCPTIPSDVESRLRGEKNVEHAQLSRPVQSPTNIGGAYKAEGV